MVGAHTNDVPNSNTTKYVGVIKQAENNKPSDESIEVEFYADYNEVKRQ